jgi:hypothetical protein
MNEDPLANHPIMQTMRGSGFEIVHIGPHVLHGGGSGHATVLYGGLPIGTVDRDGFGEWEFTPGDPGAHVEVVQPTVERVEPVEPAPTLFVAMCTAFVHDPIQPGVDPQGVWYGTAFQSSGDADAERLAHEHGEAFVHTYTAG